MTPLPDDTANYLDLIAAEIWAYPEADLLKWRAQLVAVEDDTTRDRGERTLAKCLVYTADLALSGQVPSRAEVALLVGMARMVDGDR